MCMCTYMVLKEGMRTVGPNGMHYTCPMCTPKRLTVSLECVVPQQRTKDTNKDVSTVLNYLLKQSDTEHIFFLAWSHRHWSWQNVQHRLDPREIWVGQLVRIYRWRLWCYIASHFETEKVHIETTVKCHRRANVTTTILWTIPSIKWSTYKN